MSDTTASDLWTTTPSAVPEPRPDVVPLLRSDQGTVLLVDLSHRTVHTVNVTGGMIWAQCDGALTVAEITDELAQRYAIDAAAIADDVQQSVTDFRQRGLLRTPDDPPFSAAESAELRPGPDGSRYLVPAPCSCGVDLETLEWAGTVAVGVGPVRLGVRYDTEATGTRVREAMAPWLIDDPDVPVTFTVVLLDDDDPPEGPILRSGWYEGRRWQMSTTDHDDILANLVQRVQSWVPLRPTEVRLSAIGVEGPRGTVLAPAFHGFDDRLRELVESEGWRYLPAPVVVDTEHGTIAGRPVTGVVWPGAETERLEPDDALSRLVSLSEIRVGDDIEQFADALDLLASKANAILTPAEQLGDVIAALARSR